jgi:hypothetical protein
VPDSLLELGRRELALGVDLSAELGLERGFGRDATWCAAPHVIAVYNGQCGRMVKERSDLASREVFQVGAAGLEPTTSAV